MKLESDGRRTKGKKKKSERKKEIDKQRKSEINRKKMRKIKKRVRGKESDKEKERENESGRFIVVKESSSANRCQAMEACTCYYLLNYNGLMEIKLCAFERLDSHYRGGPCSMNVPRQWCFDVRLQWST